MRKTKWPKGTVFKNTGPPGCLRLLPMRSRDSREMLMKPPNAGPPTGPPVHGKEAQDSS